MSLLEEPRSRQDGAFTGRADELALFSAVLADADRGRVYLVYGPGGVGKTALLQEIARLCQPTGSRAVYIDAGEHGARPDAVMAALAPAMVAAPPGETKTILLVDGWDGVSILDSWLRKTLVPLLPEHLVLVLAQRNPPDRSWCAMPGWGTLVRPVPLENLSDAESRCLLDRLGTPPSRLDDALAFAHGQPLALRLVAEALALAPDFAFEAGCSDVVQTLVRKLVDFGTTGPQRALLEAASAVRSVTEPLIEALFPGEDAHALFRWLARLAFVEASATGLHLHDLARDVIGADLRWRNPERWTAILERAYVYLGNKFTSSSGAASQRFGLEVLFLSRHAPWLGPSIDFGGNVRIRVELAQPSDYPALRALVAEKEGEESAELAAEWMRRQPDAVYTYSDDGPGPAGISIILTLDARSRKSVAWDPGTAAAYRAISQLGGALRPGEVAHLGRHCFGRDSYQDPSAYFLEHLSLMNRLQVTQPGIRYCLYVVAEPDRWAPQLEPLDLVPLVEGQFTVGGRSYGMFANSFLRILPMQFFRRSFAAITTGQRITPSAKAPLQRLERPELTTAVRNALRDLHEDRVFAENPLVDSRLVWVHVEKDDRVERTRVLRGLLLDSTRGMEPLLGTIVQRTYIDRVPQKEVAYELRISWSSYRRALTRAVERIAEQLWEQEIG
jgi:hypothetical protein